MLLLKPKRTVLSGIAILLLCQCFVALASAFQSQSATENSTTRVSRFGEYAGYSKPAWDKWVLESRYLEMRDGTRLAIDVVRPSADGKTPTEQKVPVLWTHSRYHRNQKSMNPRAESMVDSRSDLQRLVRHGYAIATVGVRGSGASFGKFEGLLSPNETRDAYEIVDWLSSQPWCTGSVGMFGGSYLGMTQYMAASQGHPALKAIFPNVAGFDLYDTIYPGGVFRRDMVVHWDALTRMLDNDLVAARVQTDQDGNLLQEAIKQHADNWPVLEEYEKALHRDTTSDSHSWSTHNPSAFLDAINESKVPAYHWNGFHDIFVTDAALWFANYKGPQKLGIGPWSHAVFESRWFMAERMRLQAVEQHRWFDYWLKGIDNGIMDEPAVAYSVQDEGRKFDWVFTNEWPPKRSSYKDWFLSATNSGSIKSVNDGSLQDSPVTDQPAADRYPIDVTTTTGNASRWDNAVGQGALGYGDLAANDRKSLTYTTAPLESDLTVSGHPVANLFVQCTEPVCDLFVLLEEVDENGVSTYVSEGVLRTSRRLTSDPPWNNLGLPYQRCFESDQVPMDPDEIAEIQMDLHPVSVIFNKGHRIRMTIMCADKDNAEPLDYDDDAALSVYHGAGKSSRLLLPVATDNQAESR